MSSVQSGSVSATEKLFSLPSCVSDDGDRSKDKDKGKDKGRERLFSVPRTSDDEADKANDKDKDRERLFSFPWTSDDDSRDRRNSRYSDEERELEKALFHSIKKSRKLSRGSSKIFLKEPTFVSIASFS